MYKSARIKLTFIYSFIFFAIFWSLSFGIYFWFSHSLGGEGYITKVRERHIKNPANPTFNIQHETTTIIAGNIALEQLGDILIISNGFLFFIIPAASWLLTKKTLSPIEEAYEQQKQFVSDASHEMRTPLSILSGEMEVALKKKRTLPYYQKILTSSKEEIDRLSLLIGNLLFLARGDYGNLDRKLEQVDITDLLNSLVFELNRKTSQKKLKVEFMPAKEAVVVNGQASMLRILFANLLDNAIKYTPEGGNIRIRISKTNRLAIVSIKDSGIGISQKDQKRIFDRFYRVDASRSKSKGFGLGLSIVKSIVDLHKGKILVKSQVGRGSTFSVYLPKSS